MQKKTAPEARRFATAASLASILSFILVGLLLWNKLPDEIAVHFDFSGRPDQYEPKSFVVFWLPLIMAGFQVVCVLSARSSDLSRSVSTTILWIVPGISLCVFVLMYCSALGYAADVGLWCELAIGVVAIVLGNVMPKDASRMQLGAYTARLSADDKQKIARFWGYCLVCCGIAMCGAALADSASAFFAAAAAASILPPVYTWRQVRRLPHA